MTGEPLADWEREFLESQLPKITDVERLTLKPGDRIVVHVAEHIDEHKATALVKGLGAWLPDGVPVMIFSGGTTLTVLEAG